MLRGSIWGMGGGWGGGALPFSSRVTTYDMSKGRKSSKGGKAFPTII